MDKTVHLREAQSGPLVSRDMKCCDSNLCNISPLVDISHFVPTFKLRQMLVLLHHEM